MQKRRITAITLVLAMVLALSASAAARYETTTKCDPILTFSGTTATCELNVKALAGSTITATLALYRDGVSTPVKTWSGGSLNGTTSVTFTGTYPGCVRGAGYTLYALVSVDGPGGHDEITKQVSATCR